MHFSGKPINQITLAELRSLIDNGVQEGPEIEYKRELKIDSDQEKQKFLAQICSFANTRGGHIVYGINEDKGIPQSLDGFSIPDFDALKLRMDTLLQDSIERRIPGIDYREIKISASASALLIHVPMSWNRPHLVNHKGLWRCYGRNSAGKYPLDWAEVRNLFLQNQTLTDRIRAFRKERCAVLLNGESPVFEVQTVAVVHIIPFESFSPGFQVDLTSANSGQFFLPPLGASGHDYAFNFDGYLAHQTDRQNGKLLSYMQLFRSGIVEGVDTRVVHGGKLQGSLLEQDLFQFCTYFDKARRLIQIGPPFAILYSILNAKGQRVSTGSNAGRPIDRDHLLFQETVLTDFTTLPQSLRATADSLWNASGFNRSMSFTSDGQWQPRV